ncbi:MAG: ImmA/IrrE family metallo-endopeptidase [Blastocatellia bacterium]|nr:ImmA/IrrE family metallo-endopeptidase [Blastocatellia bacterium]
MNKVSTRPWRHKSVRALIRSAGGGDPIDIIRARSKNVVETAKRSGWRGPPFNPLELASLRGIRSRQADGLFSAEAQLTPMEGRQLLLEFNPDRAPARKNYSICHELVHTLFDDCYEMVHQRKSNPQSFDPQQEVEQLCQVGAAEILMPEEDFLADLKQLGLSLSNVPELCQRYEASREAVARRMLTLANETAALVFLSRRLKPSESRGDYLGGFRPQEKLRILYVVQTPDFPAFLPAHKSAPDQSCAYVVSIADNVSQGRECWDVSGFGDWRVEAMGLPVPDPIDPTSACVMALVLPER